MQTVKCPECGEEVYEEAFLCPKCDTRLITRGSGFFRGIFTWLFVLFNLFMVFALYGTLTDTSKDMGVEELSIFFGLWVIGAIMIGVPFRYTQLKN